MSQNLRRKKDESIQEKTTNLPRDIFGPYPDECITYGIDKFLHYCGVCDTHNSIENIFLTPYYKSSTSCSMTESIQNIIEQKYSSDTVGNLSHKSSEESTKINTSRITGSRPKNLFKKKIPNLLKTIPEFIQSPTISDNNNINVATVIDNKNHRPNVESTIVVPDNTAENNDLPQIQEKRIEEKLSKTKHTAPNDDKQIEKRSSVMPTPECLEKCKEEIISADGTPLSSTAITAASMKHNKQVWKLNSQYLNSTTDNLLSNANDNLNNLLEANNNEEPSLPFDMPHTTHNRHKTLYSARKIKSKRTCIPQLLNTQWALTKINYFDDTSRTYEIMTILDKKPPSEVHNCITTAIFAVLPDGSTVCYEPTLF